MSNDINIDLREEDSLLKLVNYKKEITKNFKTFSNIRSNEEYERKSANYYNQISDLKQNISYSRYMIYAIIALKQGYKMGADDISMGFYNVEERMPLVNNEEEYLIKKINKDLEHPIKTNFEKRLIMELFISYYKKAIKEKGDRFVSIDVEPVAELEKFEKEGYLNKILEKLNNNKVVT